MKFKTDIALPSVLTEIPHTEHILMMGSCFSEHIGRRMKEEKFDCTLNPFGIVFNPLSILQALQRLKENNTFQASELVPGQGLWHSLMHHGSFSAPSQEETLAHIRSSYPEAAARYAGNDLLILTWGSAYVYIHKEKGTVVANCHKLPASHFQQKRLSMEEIIQPYTPFLKEWLAERPGRRVLLTVSPVRHLRDGLHENQLSKATLLLAADALQQAFPGQVHYFPAYEILMDELRDYRFYDADMLHPSPVTVEYIYEQFSSCCFPSDTQRAARECRELSRMLSHRPLHPDSPAWQEFRQRTRLKITELQLRYPYLSFQKEIESCDTP